MVVHFVFRCAEARLEQVAEGLLVYFDVVYQFFQHGLLADELILKLFQTRQNLGRQFALDHFFEPVFKDDYFVGKKFEFIIPQFVLEVEGLHLCFYCNHGILNFSGDCNEQLKLPAVILTWKTGPAQQSLLSKVPGFNLLFDEACQYGAVIFITRQDVPPKKWLN